MPQRFFPYGGPLTLFLVGGCAALAGCAAPLAGDGSVKPVGGKADSDAVRALCRDAGAPTNCDICGVRGWYNDGECDEFCGGTDPDCEGSPLAGGGFKCDATTPFGLGDNPLKLDEFIASTSTYRAENATSLTPLLQGQMLASLVHLGVLDQDDPFDLVFAAVDEGLLFVHQLEGLRGERFTWVQSYLRGTEVGAVFEPDTLTLLAEIRGEQLFGCVPEGPRSGPVVMPVVDAHKCHWDLPHPFRADMSDLVDGIQEQFAYERGALESIPPEHQTTLSAAARHLSFYTLPPDALLEDAFNDADEDRVYLYPLETAAGGFDFVERFEDGLQRGVVFPTGTLDIVAEIEDGQVLGCLLLDE